MESSSSVSKPSEFRKAHLNRTKLPHFGWIAHPIAVSWHSPRYTAFCSFLLFLRSRARGELFGTNLRIPPSEGTADFLFSATRSNQTHWPSISPKCVAAAIYGEPFKRSVKSIDIVHNNPYGPQ